MIIIYKDSIIPILKGKKVDEKEFFLSNAKSIIVVQIIHLHQEEETSKMEPISSLSYHLHFLVSRNEEEIYVRCLDTNDLISSVSVGISDVDGLITELVKNFFEIESHYFHNSILTAQNLFSKADQVYWDKFNEIKENSYARTKNDYLSYVTDRRAKLVKYNLSSTPPGLYSNPLFENIENGKICKAYKREEHSVK